MNYGVLPWVGNQLDKGYIQNTQKGYSKITLERANSEGGHIFPNYKFLTYLT